MRNILRTSTLALQHGWKQSRIGSRRAAIALLLAGATLSATPGMTQTAVPTPAEFFGFEPGSDGKYTSWEQEIEFFNRLDAASDRMEVRQIGTSTLGKPFLVITISSPANLAKAARYREIARKLSDPRGLSQDEINALAAEGKVVVLQTLGQHSTEVASSQTAPLYVHHLVTATDETTKMIMDNVILVLIPSFNPDGFAMVKEWTAKTAGTPYQGLGLPEMYHHYAGHDNNRDAYMLNLKESKLWAQVAYREWFPQIYNDTHQQGPFASRIFLPPKTDPVLPDVDPLVWRELMLLGAGMATRLEAAGVQGVETQAGSYTSWQMPTFHGMTPARNIVGFHTESASSQLIWPLEVKPEQLQPADRGRPHNGPQVGFPNPWPGGVWRMGDIVRQQKIALIATLETAARNREMFLLNMATMGQRQVKRGTSMAPYAHVIPAVQHDPGTTAKLIANMLEAGIEVHRATTGFAEGGLSIKPGDYVIRSDQPMRGYIHSLFVPYVYPDNPWTRHADGTPMRPKDFASTNLPEAMGVTATPVTAPLSAKAGSSLALIAALPQQPGRITGRGSAGWLLTPTWNDSFLAVTEILKAGGMVSRLTAPPKPWAPGTFWIPAGGAVTPQMIAGLATKLGLPFEAVSAAPTGDAFALKPMRIGLYRRFHGGSMDEGWTRFLFDNSSIPYTRIDGTDVRAGNLSERFDVIIVPDDNVRALIGPAASAEPYPAEYSKSLGEEGIEALKAYAKGGGSIIFMAGASDLAIEKFGIPVKNVVDGVSSKQFFAPGSMLRTKFETSKPLAYGMPAEGLVLYDSAPVFDVAATGAPGITAAASYPSGKLLQSGWLDGEALIASKTSLLEVAYGKGRLVLTGFGPQNRAQTHGTFKVLFNAIYLPGPMATAAK